MNRNPYTFFKNGIKNITIYIEMILIPLLPSLGEEQFWYATARSWHPGGVNAVYADGHVSLFSDSIDLFVWQALATYAGNDVGLATP